MNQVEVVDVDGRPFGVCPEFLFWLSMEDPHFIWLKRTDELVCLFGKKTSKGDCERLSPLSNGGHWSGVDLNKNRTGQVIGFSTLHLFPASEMIPRIFVNVKEETISLYAFLCSLKRICEANNPNLGFGDYFEKHPLIPAIIFNLKLSYIDLERKSLIPLTRENFLALGGKLLS